MGERTSDLSPRSSGERMHDHRSSIRFFSKERKKLVSLTGIIGERKKYRTEGDEVGRGRKEEEGKKEEARGCTSRSGMGAGVHGARRIFGRTGA